VNENRLSSICAGSRLAAHGQGTSGAMLDQAVDELRQSGRDDALPACIAGPRWLRFPEGTELVGRCRRDAVGK
jgi:hypothetical protein